MTGRATATPCPGPEQCHPMIPGFRRALTLTLPPDVVPEMAGRRCPSRSGGTSTRGLPLPAAATGESRHSRTGRSIAAAQAAIASGNASRRAMATAFAKEARRVHERGHLSDQLIARATGAARSTVRGWLALRSEPTGRRAERVVELSALVERLVRVMEPDYIPVWLTKPLEALDDEKPIELIARGDYVRVARLVSSLEEPGAA